MSFCSQVWFGDLLLHGPDEDEPYAIMADGFSLGSPMPTYEAINSLMVDGSFESSPGHANRESLQFTVRVTATDTRSAAELAQALELEVQKPFNELVFITGDDAAPVTVLETFVAGMSHDWDQDADARGERYYVLTIPALPFARSADPVTIEWAASTTLLDSAASLTGWSWTGTAPTVSASPGFEGLSLGGSSTVRKTFTIDRDYLWLGFKHSVTHSHVGEIGGLTVDGVAIPDAEVRHEQGDTPDTWFIHTADVSRWRGQTVEVAFTVSSGAGKVLRSVWTVDYPTPATSAVPSTTVAPTGIGVIDVKGSARTGCVIEFTAPTGGAFVLTAPDPNVALRERGAGEMFFAHVDVTDATGAEIDVDGRLIHYPQGEHSGMIGFTHPQPVEVYPDGVWPQDVAPTMTGTGTIDAVYRYPTDPRAAVSFYDTTGAKALVSPSPRLPEGYHGGAIHHEVHALHPERCGFAVLDIDGDPIPTTITYYPRNLIHAAH